MVITVEETLEVLLPDLMGYLDLPLPGKLTLFISTTFTTSRLDVTNRCDVSARPSRLMPAGGCGHLSGRAWPRSPRSWGST